MLSTSTLFVTLFAAFALFGVTLAVARRSLPESPEVGEWSRGIWLLVAGFVLLVSRALGPSWLAIIGGNALVFAGLHLNAQALNRFILKRAAPRLQVGLMLLGIVCTALMIGQPLPVRTAVISVLLALQVAPMAVLVFAKGWHAEPSLRTVGITLATTVIALAVRAMHASLFPRDYEEFFQVSVGNGLTYFASYLFPLGAGIGFILANLERTTRRMQATSHDLSRALHDLQHSEERFKAVVKDQDDVVCRFDAQGSIVFANDTCLRTFGLAQDNLNAKTWESVVVPEDLPAVKERRKALGPDNPVVVTEHRIVDAQGALRWMEFVNRAFYDADGTFQGLQTVGRDVTQRKVLEAELARTNERVHDLSDHAPCGYHSLDANGLFIHINSTELSWLGCQREEVVGKLHATDFFTAEGREQFLAKFPLLEAEGRIEGLEFDLVSRDGRLRRVSVSATAIKDAAGKLQMSRSVMYDISELHRVRTQLQQLSRAQQAMLETDIIGITRLRDRRSVWSNHALERIFGYGPGELAGVPSRQLYLDDESHDALGREAYPLLREGRTYRSQIQMRRKDGQPIWVEVSGVLLSEDTDESLWMMQDITAQKQYQQQVERIAFHDALTGLPNRLLLSDRLRQLPPLCERMQSRFAVAFIDLDGFKAVNDGMGHEAGDELLKEVSRRLQACVRTNDTVARLGGDEFVVLLFPIQTRDDCQVVLDRILAALSEPVALRKGRMARVSASIGVAIHQDDSVTPTELLSRADRAMYAAKRAGRNQVCFSALD